MKIHSSEYYELKAFFREVWLLIQPKSLPPDANPYLALEGIERERPQHAAKGLQMAVNDILEMLSRTPQELIRRYDAVLAQKGCLTLSQARVRHWKKLRRLLDAQRIRTEVDYYLLKGLVDGTDLLDQEQRRKATELLAKFEERVP